MGEALGIFDNGLGETTKIVVANIQPEKVYGADSWPAWSSRPGR